MIFWQLFWAFFKIGLTCFGGGYAMIGFIQDQVVEKTGWIQAGEFTDIVAISQMTPGPIGINMATYTGYIASGHNIWGSVIATFAICLPSVFIVLVLGLLLSRYRHNPIVEDIFKLLRLVVVGLIAAAAIQLMSPEVFLDYKSVILCIAVFAAGYYLKIHPVLLLIFAGIIGYLIY